MNRISMKQLIFLVIIKSICLIHIGGGKGKDLQSTTFFAVAMKGQSVAKSSSFKARATAISSSGNGRRLGGGKGGSYRYYSGSHSSYRSGGNAYSSNQNNQAYSSYNNRYYDNSGGGTNSNTNNNYTGSYSQTNQSRSMNALFISLLAIIILIGIALVYLSIPQIMACTSANKNRRNNNEAVMTDYHKFRDKSGKEEVNTTKAVAHGRGGREATIIVHSGRRMSM